MHPNPSRDRSLAVPSPAASPANGAAGTLEVPSYLTSVYWWAYVHPRAVEFFERQWLVNLILWGNFGQLRDAALARMGEQLPGKTLQIACVYGNLTERMARRVPDDAQLDVVDILPVQLDNLRRKLPADSRVGRLLGNSAHLRMADGEYDRALLFFLLHEQPVDVRRATIAEALRIVKPGGQLVIVDYHRPTRKHPLWWPMKWILGNFEPFALDLWNQPVTDWFPTDRSYKIVEHSLSFGGLYQLMVVTT
jgi:ubiquinone/menaquinone biosynthesis C-methylase UbiE